MKMLKMPSVWAETILKNYLEFDATKIGFLARTQTFPRVRGNSRGKKRPTFFPRLFPLTRGKVCVRAKNPIFVASNSK